MKYVVDMKYIVDIDNTICATENSDYKNSKPLLEHIEKINKLYDAGHEIHYWTARGSNSGIDWLLFTIAQLDSWGCKYHSIKTGKPAYDVWIDDKAINADTYFK
jgi:hypothetical protein